MATAKQKKAARKNLEKARAARKDTKKSASKKSAPKKGNGSSAKGGGLSTADKDDLPRRAFAFPKQRKEPLTDARHVRNAVARFDQVEGVSDEERKEAWKRITKAAKAFDVEIEASGWRELMKGGKAGKSRRGRPSPKG